MKAYSFSSLFLQMKIDLELELGGRGLGQKIPGGPLVWGDEK